jgi:hypothetical protein
LEIKSESKIHYPRERVWLAYRDRLPEIAKYNRDIKEILVLSRTESGPIVELHNEWASAAEVPPVASKLLRPEQLRWDDFARWDGDTYVCDWTIRTRAFTDAVTCVGRNAFLEDGDGTRVVLTGDFAIDLNEIPGVPKFLASTIAPQVEKFIVSLITPNLERINESLEKFLDDGR